MRLRIITPLTIAVDTAGVRVLRAEDPSGSFGIQPGHADFLTSLAVGVVRWQGNDDVRHYCAVRHGVLTVSGGQDILIATREAVASDDLATLDQTVLARYREEIETDRVEHAEGVRLQLHAIRQMVRHLTPGGRHAAGTFE